VNRDDREAFLSLPGRLYPWPVVHTATEAALVDGTHVLSKHCTVRPHVLRRRGESVGRCAVTTYSDDTTAYLGFFECADAACADDLFGWAHTTARAAGCTQVVGPVDASFWLRYRLKTDGFDRAPYTSEPWNLESYPALWRAAGYHKTMGYSSTLYRAPTPDEADDQLAKRLSAASEHGYRVEALDLKHWDDVLTGLHALVMELYAGMPVFRPVDLDDFRAIFAPVRLVADPDLVTLAWRGDDLVAFSVVLPDYTMTTNARLTPATLARLWWRRRHPHRVVALYMGSSDPGLGTAMGGRLFAQCHERHLSCVAALVGDGKPTAGYAPQFVESRSHYELLTTVV